MSFENLHELAEFIIKTGLSLGADQVEAYAIQGNVRSIHLERGAIRQFTDTSSSGVGIRIIKNKAIGMASTTIFSKESIEKTVKEAYSLARAIPPDPHFESLPIDKTPTPKIEGLNDPEIRNLEVDNFVQIIEETINEAKVKEDAIITGRFSTSIGNVVIMNSLGTERNATQTSIGGYVGVKIDEQGDIGNAYYGDNSPTLKDFDHITVGKIAGERALKMLGGKKIESKKLPVLLDPESTYGTIAPIIANGINAFSVFNRTAFFVDKIGDVIASEKLTVVDEPFYPRGTDSTPFDDEGVVPKKLTLIENGVLKTYITDSYTAPLVNLENTGHANRPSFASRPMPSPYALQISAGDASKDSLLEDMKEGVLLIDSSIMTMGNNPRISAQINQGFYVKDGEIQHPIKNALIGTTVFDVLQSIEYVSKETENRHGRIAPWIQLAPLQVSGGK